MMLMLETREMRRFETVFLGEWSREEKSSCNNTIFHFVLHFEMIKKKSLFRFVLHFEINFFVLHFEMIRIK